ncbi:hypothetical protein BH11ARM2_BH11ARM2_09820 [soil metagenome]
MKITILVEGRTEKAFAPILREFLGSRLGGNMPNLDFFTYDGRLPKGESLKRKVETVLAGRNAPDHVIALTDVYTGTEDFTDATDAKIKMRDWVGNEPRFTPHVALHDFEAWLIPYWEDIKKLAGHNKAAPGTHPERINHNKPPSYHIKEVFEAGGKKSYVKTRDSLRILRGKDLGAAIVKCPELKAFVNTILQLCGGEEIA